MCRYAFKNYKSHFACFKCRKTFKQAPFVDLLRPIGKAEWYEKLSRKSIWRINESEKLQLDDLKAIFNDREIKCPECGDPMADLGLDFKSPKKSAEKEWKIVEMLYAVGKNFYSCGCSGVGYIPKNMTEYRAYLNKVLAEYEYGVAFYQSRTLKEYRDKAERIAYWKEKAEVIKECIDSL